MTAHAQPPVTRPLPRTISPNDAALRAIAEAREAALMSQTATERLLELAELEQTPPEFHPITLTAAKLTDVNRAHTGRSLSLGIINPSAARIYLGIGGVSARQGSGAVSVPASSMAVLPVPAEALEVGVDAADVAAGDATFYLLRYRTVQPAMFGAF